METDNVAHARQELVILGATPETINEYLSVIQAFDETYQPEGYTNVNIEVLTQLLYKKPITPLTNDPDEWMLVGDRIWQSTRSAEAFSYDQGLTHYLLSEREHDPMSIHITEPKKVEPIDG